MALESAAMGQNVEFPSNSHTCQGYFAAPTSGKGPGIVVIQEIIVVIIRLDDRYVLLHR